MTGLLRRAHAVLVEIFYDFGPAIVVVAWLLILFFSPETCS